MDLFDPFFYQGLPGWRPPVLFKIGMASGTLSTAIVMAKAAFQWLVPSPIKFTKIASEKRTAIFSKQVGGNRGFTAFEGRRKHPNRQLGGNLEHHPVPIACFEGAGSLLDRPPAGTGAVGQTNRARTRLGRRIFLGKSPFEASFSFGHAGLLTFFL